VSLRLLLTMSWIWHWTVSKRTTPHDSLSRWLMAAASVLKSRPQRGFGQWYSDWRSVSYH